MRNYKLLIFIYLVCVLSLSSCSVDNKLEPSIAPKVSVLEESPCPLVKVGDTVSFKIIASTNDKLEQVIISDKSHDFETLPEGIKLELVDSCTIDASGFFSRPVSTVIVNYPIIVPDLVGEEASMKFIVVGGNGLKTSVISKFLIVGFTDNSNATIVWANNWYKAESHQYASSWKWKRDTTSMSMFLSKNNSTGVFTMYGPQDEFLQTHPSLNGYDPEIMGETKFIKIDESAKYESFYDSELEALDFTEYETHMDVTVGETIGFQLFNGRKGILKFTEYQYNYYPKFISRLEKSKESTSDE